MNQYIVDAFTDKIFSGNPAAICILDKWISDDLMIKIASENNLSETAFAVKEGQKYHLRWFTPGCEIDLCGHATLACAFVLLNFYEKDSKSITFKTLSGDLIVKQENDLYEMDFPAFKLTSVPVTEQMTKAIGATPDEAYKGRDLLCVFKDSSIITKLDPNQQLVKELDGLLLHVTARGNETDCISRTFAPKCNVVEDPVCGSGHCHIVPYWSRVLNKDHIVAYQASKRGGTLYCKIDGDRVILAGKAALFSEGKLHVLQ